VWLALTHPLLALAAGLAALAVAVTFVVWLGRRALGVLARYRGRGSGRASSGRVSRNWRAPRCARPPVAEKASRACPPVDSVDA
jgi:hypothetical protein